MAPGASGASSRSGKEARVLLAGEAGLAKGEKTGPRSDCMKQPGEWPNRIMSLREPLKPFQPSTGCQISRRGLLD